MKLGRMIGFTEEYNPIFLEVYRFIRGEQGAQNPVGMRIYFYRFPHYISRYNFVRTMP